ncbi:MAG: hypothetical protein ABSB14_03730 [Candidatus Sulfotelmatobacter sp.]|jgi:hypothetical protein
MKTTALVSWALIVAIGLVLAIVAIQQPAQSASKNVTPLPAPASNPAASRGPSGGTSKRLNGSTQDSAITVAVHPVSAPITSMVKQQFTVTVTGTTNTAVTWYVDAVLGGNQTVGRIDGNGLYTPPANFAVGKHTVTAVSQSDRTKSGSATGDLVGYAGLYTNKNDNSRTGQNLQETVLTPQNVRVATFGKLFSYAIDASVTAQPLYVANVYVPNPLHGTAGYYNVIYIATSNDSVYAYDADGNVTGTLWYDSFINPPTVVAVPGACVTVGVPTIGIMPTPVIDPTTNTMYVEARTLEGQTTACTGTYVYRMHALDITTGLEKFGGPVEIQASIPGTGIGSVNGTLAFDPRWENARAGLLLSQAPGETDSTVYLATASPEDTEPYHGWILGYDSQTLALKYAFCSTPNGSQGGIWHRGGGLAADANGNIFVQTGNGTFDTNGDYGQSVLKLTPSNGNLGVADSYTPSNYSILNQQDWDLSSGGLLLLPDQPGKYPHLMVGGGKEGTIYLINRDNLGGYHAQSNNIVQHIVGAIRPSVPKYEPFFGIWNTSSYFNGNVYIFGQYDYPKMFTLNNGLLPTTATSAGAVIMRGPNPVISANGSANGIVWALQYDTVPPVLWAFNPSDLAQVYYNTNQDPQRDKVDSKAVERVNPTVANGRVYVPASSKVQVYGLLQ